MKINPLERIFFIALIWLSIYTTIACVAYFSYAFTLPLIIIDIILASLATYYISHKHITRDVATTETPPKTNLSLKILTVALAGFLLICFNTFTTVDILTSPWLILPNYVYAVYFAFIFCTIYLYWRGENRPYFAILAFFITYSVVSFVYRLGFGYDPFLHRAAEQHIADYGFIAPKTPFYIGQYVLIVGLAKILPISLKFFDIWLVPSLTSILIPIAAMLGMRQFALRDKIANYFSLFLILAVPLATFIFTTPNNFSNIFLFALILISPAILNKTISPLYAIPLMVLSVLAHPLPGIFAILFGIYLLLGSLTKKLQTFFQILLSIGALVAIPSLMLIWSHAANSGIDFEWRNILSNASKFISIFSDPYYFRDNPIPFYLEIIYIYRKLVYVLLIASAVGYAIFHKSYRVHIVAAALLTVVAYFLATTLSIRDLGGVEILSYALRILELLIFFLIPGAIGAITVIFSYLKRGHIPLLIILAGTIFCSWYLAYPQSNKKVFFPGQNVTVADYDTTKYIHDAHPDKNYIVLTNIVTAATAIEQFGFEKYYEIDGRTAFHYSTPSGSPLYDAYMKLIYESTDRRVIDDLFTKTKAHTIYFVLSRKWADFQKISDRIEKISDDTWPIKHDEIRTFIFYAPTGTSPIN